VWDIIGRALVVYEHAEHTRGGGANVAAVIARSAVAGDNTKKICACDGTLIWEAGDLIPPRGAAARGRPGAR
jgi:copper chaperone for superoxide dismutase